MLNTGLWDDFVNFLEEMGNPKIWYWHAEDRFWKSACANHFDRLCDDQEEFFKIRDKWELDNMCDLARLFRQEPIVIKGVFDYGLKNIAKAMNKHGMD